MKEVVLFDGPQVKALLPLTFVRPLAMCMVGMTTIFEKWNRYATGSISFATQEYLQDLYKFNHSPNTKVYINGGVLPSESFLKKIGNLRSGEYLKYKSSVVAFKSEQNLVTWNDIQQYTDQLEALPCDVRMLHYPEDLLDLAPGTFEDDYAFHISNKESASLDTSSKHRGRDLFIGSNTIIYDSIINSEGGPVYIDDDVEIMENSVIKGPVYIGKGTKIHVGSKIYAGSMLGPQCRIGGEVKRSTLFGYSNKAHDGYLGDSILCMWCNLGADTNNSNMKNTYGKVSLYDYSIQDFRKTERQFLGMVLGDHTLSAINTSFNTGSVTGIFCNITNARPNRHVPSFTWRENEKYDLEKAISIAEIAMKRRNVVMSKSYENLIRHIHSLL